MLAIRTLVAFWLAIASTGNAKLLAIRVERCEPPSSVRNGKRHDGKLSGKVRAPNPPKVAPACWVLFRPTFLWVRNLCVFVSYDLLS